MIRDVENHLVRTLEFGFIKALVPLRPPGKTLSAEFFDFAGHLVDVFVQHTKMVNATEVEPRTLISAEMKHRKAQGAVAEENAVRLVLIVAFIDPADLTKIKRLLVELGRCKWIFRSKRDVTKLGHGGSQGCETQNDDLSRRGTLVR
jgi:hypothetical protein